MLRHTLVIISLLGLLQACGKPASKQSSSKALTPLKQELEAINFFSYDSKGLITVYYKDGTYSGPISKTYYNKFYWKYEFLHVQCDEIGPKCISDKSNTIYGGTFDGLENQGPVKPLFYN